MFKRQIYAVLGLVITAFAVVPTAYSATAQTTLGPVEVLFDPLFLTFSPGSVNGTASVEGGSDVQSGDGTLPLLGMFTAPSGSNAVFAYGPPFNTPTLASFAGAAPGTGDDSQGFVFQSFFFTASGATTLEINVPYSLSANPGTAPSGGYAYSIVGGTGSFEGASIVDANDILSLTSPDAPDSRSGTFSSGPISLAGAGNGFFVFAVNSGAGEPLAVAAIPEPSTYALMLAGLGVVGFVARRRRKAHAASA